jgi:hypothetical protein
MITDMNAGAYDTWEELCILLGENTAERLSIELGGQRYWLGRGDNERLPNRDLIICLGVEDARFLSFRFSREMLHIPIVGRLAARNRLIYQLAKNCKVKQIARSLGMTEQGIRKILKSFDGARNQEVGVGREDGQTSQYDVDRHSGRKDLIA